MKYIKRAELVKTVQKLEEALANQPAISTKSKIKYVPDTKETKRLESIIASKSDSINAAYESIDKSDKSIRRLQDTNDILEKRIEIRDKTITGYRNGIDAYKELGFWAKIGMAFKSRLDVDMFFITKR